MAFQYLFAPTTQFQARTGANNTAGFLRVFYTQTDDRAVTYSDFGGTENEADIVLDNDGRAVVIVDDSKTYRLEVYGVNQNLLFTVDPLTAVGGGSGGASITKIISTDGTVGITVTSIGGMVTYDLSTSFEDKPSHWGNAISMISELDGTNDWVQIPPVSSVGTSLYDNGWTVDKDTGYDIAASIEMPTGSNTAIYGIDVKCEFQVDGVTVMTETGRIDPTTPMDRVSFEWKGELTKGQKVDAKLYVKNGEAITLGLVGRALFNEECDGIIGNSSGASEYIPGEYIDISTANVISVTGVQPLSGMSSYAPNSALSSYVSNSAFTSYSSNVENILINMENNVSDISSTVSGLTGTYLEQSASALFAPSGDYAYNSSVSSKVDQSAFDNCCSAMSSTVSALETSVTAISSNVSDLTGVYLEQSASSLFQPSGDYAYNSALSGKLDTSAFSGVSGNFVQNSAFTSYTASALTAIDNSISSIQSSMSSMSSDVSGKVDQSAMSAWIPYSALDYSGTAISGIGGSSLAGMGGGGADYTGIYPVNVDNTAREIAVDSLPLVTDSSMTSYASGDSSVIGVNLNIMSGKLDSSAQVVTATATQLYAGTAYLTSVNGAPVSASRAGNAANASLANSAWYDGTGRFISALPDSATVSAIASAYTTGKQDTLTFSYDDDKISAINGSALAGQGGGGATGDYVEKSATEVAIGSDNNATTYSFAQGRSNSASSYSLVQGYINQASSYSLVQGYINQASSNSFAQGSQNKASYNSFAQGNRNSANSDSFAQGERNSANAYSFAQGYRNSASYWSFAQGSGISAKNIAAVFGLNNLHGDGDTATGDSAAFAIGDGTASGARHDLMVVTKDGEITMYSSTADTTGTGIMSAIRAISAAATGGGGIDSATCSAIASSYAESAASGKLDSSAISAYVPFSAISADENSSITSINGSSVGGTQVVTATGSANFNGTGINTINGSGLIAKSLSGAGILVGSPDPGLYLTGGNNGGTAYYKSNELVINRSGYGETIKFNLGSAGAQIYGSAAGNRGAFMQMSNDNHTAFFGAASGGDAKIELDGYSAGSANMAGWDSSWNTVSSESATWGAVTSKMDSTAVQSAYASASASQATAQGVLYILIPDGV